MIAVEEVKYYLRQLVAQAMYMEEDEILDDTLFSDIGLESVTLVKIVTKICEKYSISIQVKDLIPYQTVMDASSFITLKCNGS